AAGLPALAGAPARYGRWWVPRHDPDLHRSAAVYCRSPAVLLWRVLPSATGGRHTAATGPAATYGGGRAVCLHPAPHYAGRARHGLGRGLVVALAEPGGVRPAIDRADQPVRRLYRRARPGETFQRGLSRLPGCHPALVAVPSFQGVRGTCPFRFFPCFFLLVPFPFYLSLFGFSS